MIRPEYRIPLAAVVLSLGLRALYFAQILGNPYFDTPVMDEGYHDLWAREIAAGDLASRLPFFRAPLYPALLGGLYALLGPNFILIRAIQLAFGALTPAFTILIARRVLPGRPTLAAVSGFVVALDGVLFYFEADLLLESLLAPLATLFLWLLLRAGETGSARRWLAAGLALGAFAITRPNILLFSPVALGLALGWRGEVFTWRLRQGRAALALTLGTCLLVLPVTAANWRIGGDPVLVSSQGGLNFFLGNNAEANGWSATAPSLFRNTWWGGYEDAIALAEEAEGRVLRPSEVSDYWYGRAFAWWRENPSEGVALTVKKVVLLLSGVEFGNNRDMRFFFQEFAPLGAPALYLYAVMLPLALIGMVRRARTGGISARVVILFIIVYATTIVLFFVTARYRVPLRPLLAIFAVEGARTAWEGVRAASLRRTWPLAAAVLFAIAVNANPWTAEYQPSRAQFHQSVADVHQRKGSVEKAIESQARALEIDPTYPKGNLNLGTLYLRVGDVPAAIDHLERERVLDPNDGVNLATLALAYDRSGRTEDADRTYSAAEATGFEDAPALYNHALCLERLGRADDAEVLYLRAVRADSTFVNAWNNLGVLKARAGLLEEAVSFWKRALEIRPGDPRALDNLDRARKLTEPDDPEPKPGG